LVLKQLTYLVALAREQHFGRAAAAVNISQPTLSAAIRTLEEELGFPVVERGHKFNGLTREGQVVLDHALRIIAETEAMQQTLCELGHGLRGRLRLGVVPTALPVVSLLTAPFYSHFPDVTITVLSSSSIGIARGIESFEMEAGLTYLDSEPLEKVQSKPIYMEDYLFLTPDPGAYAGSSQIGWSEAADAPLCLLTPDMQNRRIIDRVFQSLGKVPRIGMETNSIFNLCSHTSSGHWSTIVPRPLLQFFGLPERTKAIPLVEPDITHTIGLVMADRDPASPLARAFFALVQPMALKDKLLPPRLPDGP
jgi:DNA-binding transcriptional LysR family regulator